MGRGGGGTATAEAQAARGSGWHWHWLLRHLNRRDLGLLAFAFFVGRATLFGASPLALGAVLAARPLFGSWSLLMGLAAAAGVLTARGAGGLPAAFAILLLFPLWGVGRRFLRPTWLVPVLGVFVGAVAAAPVALPPAVAASSLMTAVAAVGLGYLEAPLLQRTTLIGRAAASAGLALVAGFGVVGIRLGFFDPAYMAAVALSLLSLLVTPAGVAVAPLAGLVLAARGDLPVAGIVDLALGASLGLLGRTFGRLPSAALFLLGDLLLAPAHETPAALLGQGVAAFTGVLIVALLPDAWFQKESAPSPAFATVEEGLATRLGDVAFLLREMAVTFYEAAHGEHERAPDAAVLETINRRVCAGCRHHASCWQDGFYATYRGVRDLMAERARGAPVTAADLPAELRRKCPRPNEVALAISFAADLQHAEEGWHRREREMRALAADQIRGAAAVLERMGEELVAPAPAKERTLSYATGLAKLAKSGGAVSGDSYLVRELQDGRLVLGLADGMGVGPKAFLESSAVVSMVEKLLSLGLGQELVLRTVNAALLMRSRDDMFSTLDLALVDLLSGETELIKIGGAPTFLCHGQEVEVLTGRSVPIGILREVQWEVFYRRLYPGDLLVMVSDGVAEASRPGWVESLLPELVALDPQEIAERLLDEALERVGRRRDDMTVLATALLDGVNEAPPEIQAWVRRTLPTPGISMEHAGNTGQARGR